MYVGIVRGSGKSDLKGAKEAFSEGARRRPGRQARRRARHSGDAEASFEAAGGRGGAAAEATRSRRRPRLRKPPTKATSPGESDLHPRRA